MRIQYAPYIVTKDKKETVAPLNIRLFLFCLQYPIIPYRKILGNYNGHCTESRGSSIIPYRTILGDYNNHALLANCLYLHYTIIKKEKQFK